jgi:5-methylcytosine-specific restriction endonuclease McrA
MGTNIYESHGSYGALLLNPKWKAKRKEILARDNNKCVFCGSGDDLQVHHRQYHFSTKTGAYKPPWEYDNNLLITVCKICHQKGHGQYEVPIKKINW